MASTSTWGPMAPPPVAYPPPQGWAPWPPPPPRRPVWPIVLAGAIGLVVGLAIGAVAAFFVASWLWTGDFFDERPGLLALTYGPEGDLDLMGLELGQCAEAAPYDVDSYPADDALPCEAPHEVEVYVAEPTPGGPTERPEPGGFDELVDELCYDEFEPFTGEGYYDTYLDFQALVPSPAAWEDGERTVYCLLTSDLQQGSSRALASPDVV